MMVRASFARLFDSNFKQSKSTVIANAGEAIRIAARRKAWIASSHSLLAMTATSRQPSAISRRDAPGSCLDIVPRKQEGAGKAGCALHPRSRVQMETRKRTRAYRFSGGNPAFPAQWFYGL
jgi:hypothetical protein